jgi:membrane protease YdiL (CAAX protease family)
MKKSFPTAKDAVLIVFGLVLIEYLIAFYLATKGIRWESGNPIVYTFITISALTMLLFWLLPKMGLAFSQLFHGPVHSLSTLLILTMLPITLVIVGLHILLVDFANLYYLIFPDETFFTQTFQKLTSGGIYSIIAICLVAPIVEEILFRGVFLRSFLRQYTPTKAILLSAILFSLAHVNPAQFVLALVLGVFSGWLYYRSYSLWPSIICHILFNSLSFIVPASGIKIVGYTHYPSNQIEFMDLSVVLFGLCCVLVGYKLLKVVLVGQTDNNQNTSPVQNDNSDLNH